jgi:hypothetical protein
MELIGTEISCGVEQLNDVGPYPNETEYRHAMRDCNGAIVVASVPATWKTAISFLKKKGFTKPLRKNRNPNSGNDIVLLVRNITPTDRERFSSHAGFCEECDEAILDKHGKLNTRRKVCDDCKNNRTYW